MQVKTETVRERGGGVLLVAALHVVIIYAFAVGLGVVKVPSFAKPLEATIINLEDEQQDWKPVPVKPDLQKPDVDLTQNVPEVPVELPVDQPEPSPVATAPAQAAEVSNLKVSDRVEPVYPAASRRAGEQGTATFHVLVDERGRPGEVDVVQSSGFPRLDQSAIEAIRKWKFAAAVNGGQRVEAWTTVRVTFRLNQ